MATIWRNGSSIARLTISIPVVSSSFSPFRPSSAIEEPLRQIVANAGKEGAVVVQKVKEGKGDFGYNARTDKYENLCAAGVIDPAKVTRVALENAASIAGMFLTTECVIAEKKEEAPAAPAMNPGMGGMGGIM